MTEKELQRRVMRLAKESGWRRAHFKAAPLKNRGGRYVTPQDGEAGFPDCVFVRNGRLIFAELKAEKGMLSDGQLAWRRDLRLVEAAVNGLGVYDDEAKLARFPVEVWVWRPQDWDDGTIEAVLS